MQFLECQWWLMLTVTKTTAKLWQQCQPSYGMKSKRAERTKESAPSTFSCLEMLPNKGDIINFHIKHICMQIFTSKIPTYHNSNLYAYERCTYTHITIYTEKHTLHAVGVLDKIKRQKNKIKWEKLQA